MRDRAVKAAISVAGGFLTHLVMGAIYLWGNISLYVTSYYRINGYPDIQQSTVQAVFPFVYLGIVLGHFSGLWSARKFGHKLFSGVNMILYSFSFYIASHSNFNGFIFFMGLLPGWCIGNEYLTPVDNAYYFYPERKGLIGGVILSGVGFGALAFNPVFQYIMNPDNKTPNEETGVYDSEIAERLPRAIQTTALCYIIIGMVGVLMMFQTKKYQQMEKSLLRESIQQGSAESESNDIATIRIHKVEDAFKSRQLYIMWFQFFALSGFGFIMVSQYKVYGLLRIKDDYFFTLVGSMGGLANGLSRFMWAYLLDHYSSNILICFNVTMMVVLAATFNLIAYSKPLYMIWIILIYTQYGGLYAYFPTLASKTYGSKLGPYVYNLVVTSVALSNFTQFFIFKYFLDDLGYAKIFYIYSGLGGLVLLLHIISMLTQTRHRNKLMNS